MTYKTLISVEDLKALVDRGEALVVDCGFDLADSAAGRAAHVQGHIPGAVYLHLDEDLAAPASPRGRHPLPAPETFAEILRGAGLNAGQQVVAYDAAGGPFAARLWWLLRWLGHEAVAVLDGGKQAWIAAGFRLDVGPVVTRRGDFMAGEAVLAHAVTVEEVIANLRSRDRLVVDARAPERFRGEPNPLDPVTGHIPGARNRFYKDNLAIDGRFRSAAQLAADFAAVFGEVSAEQVILQCGSGVTACHNALALEVAGLRGAQLYPGSWSEWIQDPSRPVERG